MHGKKIEKKIETQSCACMHACMRVRTRYAEEHLLGVGFRARYEVLSERPGRGGGGVDCEQRCVAHFLPARQHVCEQCEAVHRALGQLLVSPQTCNNNVS